MRTTANRLMVGFLSVSVVFLFAVIHKWDSDLVILRSFKTTIDCAVALIVSLIMPFSVAPAELVG